MITLTRDEDFKENTPQEVIDYVYKFPVSVSFDFEKEENLDKLAGFISLYEGDWEKKNLEKAYLSFINVNLDDFVKKGIGDKTNKEPENYDIYILYKLCKDRNIETEKNYGINELRDLLIMHIYNLNINQYIIYKLNGKDKKDLLVDINKTKTNNTQKNIRRYEPYINLDIDYINHMAKIECIDISDAVFPYCEYVNYYTRKNKGKSYEPKDINMKTNYNINPNYYKLNKYYFPKYKEIYKQDILVELINLEYIDINEPDKIIAFLEEYSEKNHIYLGYLGYGKETFYYNADVKDIPDDKLYSYGKLKTKEFIYLSENELINYLKVSEEDFLDNTKELDKHTIYKIKKMLEEKNLDMKEDIIIDLETEFKKANKEEQNSLISFLRKVFDFGMMMRGWKCNAKGYYPMKLKEVNDNYTNNFEQIVLNVTGYLHELGISYNKLKNEFKTLCLMNYKNGKYTRCKDMKEGITIWGKIEMVRKADDVNSCIRASSNILISSSLYYLSKTNFLIEIIKIEDLEFVF